MLTVLSACWLRYPSSVVPSQCASVGAIFARAIPGCLSACQSVKGFRRSVTGTEGTATVMLSEVTVPVPASIPAPLHECMSERTHHRF